MEEEEEEYTLENMSAPRVAELARLFARDGAVVVPALTVAALARAHADFEETLRGFPEYLRDPLDPDFTPATADGSQPRQPIKYVGGGFGALANPASIHNDCVRKLRRTLHEHMMPLFAAIRPTVHHRVHAIVDRMRVLTADASISAETWHRDTTPDQFTFPGDVIFGGWINLDQDRSQYFNALLGSHREWPLTPLEMDARYRANAASFSEVGARELADSALTQDARERWLQQASELARQKEEARREAAELAPPSQHTAGFAKFTDAQQRLLSDYREDLPTERKRLEIPPGHLLLFVQELIHEVAPKNGTKSAARIAATPPEYRLFTAWRLTTSDEPLRPCLPENFFDDMSMPRLKSNQIMPMYPQDGYIRGTRVSARNFSQWSVRTFPDWLLKSWDRVDKKSGEVDHLRIVVREMPSLTSMPTYAGIYSDYPPEERAIYSPHETCVGATGERFSLAACVYCRTITDEAQTCGRCHRAIYCSERCQLSDWENHEQICAAPDESNDMDDDDDDDDD